jgi:beta-galactosidase
MSSGYESSSYGLINLDGAVTDRAFSAGDRASSSAGRICSSAHGRFSPHRHRVNPLAQLVGGAQQPGLPRSRNSLISYYRVFAEHNIPVDFIHRTELRRAISQYALIIVPYPIADAGRSKWLAPIRGAGRSCRRGARLAWNDERGFAARSFQERGCTGVRCAKRLDAARAEATIAETDDSLIAGWAPTLRGALYASTVASSRRTRAY